MLDAPREERWMIWINQARGFAARENYIDARQRAALVCDEVQSAIANETDERTRARLQKTLLRYEKVRADLDQAFSVWNARIAERRQRTIDGAAEEMARPQPNPPPVR